MSQPIDIVLDAEAQAALTPQAVRQTLANGNERFINGTGLTREPIAQLHHGESGQHPMAVVLSCIDSRVPVELVFDCGIGDLFVARVAGNVVNGDVLGSIEYACAVAGSKLVVVLGHQHCGAVKSAIAGVELGNITGLLAKVEPAIALVGEPDDDSTEADYVAAVTDANVRVAMDRIRAESAIIADLEADGQVAIVGAVFELSSGRVRFLQD